MAKLVKHNDPIYHRDNECWIVHFYEHKDLTFSTKEDLETYLSGETSMEHGLMEYERVPSGVSYVQYFDIDYKSK